MQIGVPVPKTILLPSKARPDDTTEKSFRNLKDPLDWDYIFNYIGFPAYMKPHAGGGWKSVYRVDNPDDLFGKHEETGQLVMMLQEEIVFEDYYRVYCLGQKYVHIMPYEPRNAFHERYATEPKTTGAEHQKLMKTIQDYTIRLNKALGYDFNTVEFAVRNGIPYAIDFCNPAPDADVHSVGQDNFSWIVEHAAKFAIEKANGHKAGQNNCSWGTFIQQAVEPPKTKPSKVPLKTAAEAKKTAQKTPVSRQAKAAAKPRAVVNKRPSKPKPASAQPKATTATAKSAAKASPAKSAGTKKTTGKAAAKTPKTKK
jgi:hypothetical protein